MIDLEKYNLIKVRKKIIFETGIKINNIITSGIGI